jgi:hypothetical protein
MASLPEVLGCMSIRRVIAAADVTTGETLAEVNPARTDGDALRADFSRTLNLAYPNLRDVFTTFTQVDFGVWSMHGSPRCPSVERG